MIASLGKLECSTIIKGTGTKGCSVDIGYTSKILLFEQGLRFNINSSEEEMSKEKINQLIQQGKIVVLPEHAGFSNEGEETVYETLPSGAKIVVRNGLYEFLIQYSKGICFGNALFGLSSKSWDLALIDSEGKLIVEETSDGYIKGFNTSLVNAENMVLNDGSVSTKNPLRVQLSTLGTKGLQSSVNFVNSSTELDWDSLEGVNDVTISVVNEDTQYVEVKVTTGCDGSTPILGLDNFNLWQVLDSNGQTVSETVTSIGGGVYKIGSLTTGNDYSIKLYDEQNGFEVISVETDFYKSNTVGASTT